MEHLFGDPGTMEVVALTTLDETVGMIGAFAAIAAEEGWQPGDGLASCVQGSVYFAVRVRGELAGGLQIVPYSVGGDLPCFAVWPELRTSCGQWTAHVPVMALKKEYRGTPGLFWLLATELWRYCFRRNILDLRLEATPRLLAFYQRIGWPVEAVGPLRRHWGEDCYPCRLELGEVASGMLEKASRSESFRQLVRQACRKDPVRPA